MKFPELRSAENIIELTTEAGFLPLFAGDIPGFSVEEMTAPEDWFSGNPAADPWLWREELAAEGALAYGKFFAGKAGFISRDCLPAFCNLRRDGYEKAGMQNQALQAYLLAGLLLAPLSMEKNPPVLLRG